MLTHIVFPNYNPSNAGSAASVFLEGPDRNAPPWQEDAIDLLTEKSAAVDSYIRICCPKEEADLVRSPPELCRITHRVSWAMDPVFRKQSEWVWTNQESAARSGGILFWLPASGEVVHPNKAYGAKTQFNLGLWLAKASNDSRLRVAIGSDGVYNNELDTLWSDIKHQVPHIPLFDSLDTLCDQAIAWAKEGEF